VTRMDRNCISYHQRLKEALALLNKLISEGMEYPDAEFKACTRHPVDHRDLRGAYDADQVAKLAAKNVPSIPIPPAEALTLCLAEADENAAYLVRASNGADVIDINRIETGGSPLTDAEWWAFVKRLRELCPDTRNRDPVTEDDGRKAVHISDALDGVLGQILPGQHLPRIPKES
jgi:hypothetical protein